MPVVEGSSRMTMDVYFCPHQSLDEKGINEPTRPLLVRMVLTLTRSLTRASLWTVCWEKMSTLSLVPSRDPATLGESLIPRKRSGRG